MLENFQVIEIKKTVTQKEAPLNVIVEPKRIRFVKAVIPVIISSQCCSYLFLSLRNQFYISVKMIFHISFPHSSYPLLCRY